jgi:hypothetical protein
MVNLLTGEEGAPNDYRLNVGRGGQKATEVIPRHRHTFDQFRCIRSGYYELGNVILEPWDIAYIPENCFYGPNRNGDENGNGMSVEIIDIQFGGASGRGYPSVAQKRKGMEALLARGGTFEKGLYTWFDENGKKHIQDGNEVMLEEIWGRKVDYPEPRYTSQVYMRPSAFEWVKDPDVDGVAWKIMGRFTERDIRCGYVQVEKGATLWLGKEPSPEFVWIKDGSLSYNGTVHPAMTAFGTTTEEEPRALVAAELSELMYFKLPTF